MNKSFTSSQMYFAVLLILLAFVAGCSPSDDILQIGAILPLSGNLADVGSNNLDAMQLAVDQINAQGGVGGRDLELVVEDNRGCNPTQAVSAMNKLVYSDKVDYVYSICSGAVLASHPIAEKEGVLHLVSGGHPELASAGEYSFRLIPPESEATAIAATYLFDTRGIREIAILHCDNEWCVSTQQEFATAFESLGGNIVLIEQIETGSQDVRSSLLGIKESSADAVFSATYPLEATSIFKQANELGLDVLFFGGPTWQDSSLAAQVPSSLDAMFVTQHQSYSQEFSELLNGTVLLATPQAYDAIYVFSLAMQRAGSTDSAVVRDELFNISYEGQSGHIEFDEGGELIGSYYDLLRFENGSFIVASQLGG